MRGRRIYAAILAAMGLLLLTGVKSGGSYDLPDGLEMKKSGFELMSLPEGPSAALPLQALNGVQPPAAMETGGTDAGESAGRAETAAAGESAGQTENAAGGNAASADSGSGVSQAAQPPAEEKYLGGARLMLLANQSASQMLSCVIQTKDGSVIVVDGGTPEDAPHLIETVQSLGGRVNAWLVTHLHNDHVGALTTILNMEECPLEIDGIYYSVASQEWYDENDPTRAQTAAAFMSAIGKVPAEKLHSDIQKGTQIQVGDASVMVMNRRYLLSVDSGNNASVAYMVTVNGRKILFLGDLGLNGGDLLLQEWSGADITCDIVQMAHHGQNGVGENFYQSVRPKICLWPAPQWLWDNDNGGGPGSGPWRTLETRSWMEKLGVTQNYCIKDGDQIIE